VSAWKGLYAYLFFVGCSLLVLLLFLALKWVADRWARRRKRPEDPRRFYFTPGDNPSAPEHFRLPGPVKIPSPPAPIYEPPPPRLNRLVAGKRMRKINAAFRGAARRPALRVPKNKRKHKKNKRKR